MTPEQTRQLGIEFERRVQTMIPEKEYLDKLDTDTIYAYLNSYQDKYIHDIYRNLDKIQSGSKLSAHVESVLQEMLRTQTISVENAKNYTHDVQDANGVVIIENGRSVTYPLDPAFYMYIRSVSNVSSTYSFKSYSDPNQPIRILPNELVSQSDVWRLLETPHNSLRILRYPAATIGAYEEFPVGKEPLYIFDGQVVTPFKPGVKYTAAQVTRTLAINFPDLDLTRVLPSDGEWPSFPGEQYSFYIEDQPYYMKVDDYQDIMKSFPTLNVIYDQYTTPVGIKIMYYAQPQRFDPMTSTVCELPMDAFDDIVTGAVDLYVQYVAGAEANKRRLQEAARQQAKQQ